MVVIFVLRKKQVDQIVMELLDELQNDAKSESDSEALSDEEVHCDLMHCIFHNAVETLLLCF